MKNKTKTTMWRRLLCLMMAICLIWAPVGCSDQQEAGPGTDGDKTPSGGNARQWLSEEPEKVPEVSDDGVYALYAVNSSQAGYLTGKSKHKLENGATAGEVTAQARMGYRFVRWSDGVTEATRSGDSFDATTVVTAIFDYDCREMPIVVLTTETGKDVTRKKDYINGSFALINTKDEYVIADAVENGIRGRGNNTWTYEKKSYKLKFTEKRSILGLGKAEKTWVLLANVCDQSLLRNDTALELMDMFDHLRHSPNAESGEVYLNGEYRGVYLLAEEITEDKAHLNLDDGGVETDVDTGYLLEMSYYAEDVAFQVAGKNFEIKSDLSKDNGVEQQQKAYIGSYVQQCWDALCRGDEKEIGQLIDLDTLVDAYIGEEIVKNLDMGWDSFYLYKDTGGKLCFGPLWDFDLSFGNGDETCQYYTELYCGRFYLAHLSNPWFYTAMQQRWFRDRVTVRWDEMHDELLTLSDGVRDKGAAYAGSFNRNFKKWDEIIGNCMNRETELIMTLSSHEEHYRYLAEWIDNRISWLNDFYHSDEFRGGAWRYEDQFAAERAAAREFADTLWLKGESLLNDVDEKSIRTTIEGFPNEGVECLFDGDTESKYCLQHTHTVKVNFRVEEPVQLMGFIVATGKDTAEYPGRNPQTFALYGSLNGEDWVDLCVVGYGHDVLGAENETEYGFAVTDTGEYRYFCFGFNNNEVMQLSELTLFAVDNK